jgi:hypothetical protein
MKIGQPAKRLTGMRKVRATAVANSAHRCDDAYRLQFLENHRCGAGNLTGNLSKIPRGVCSHHFLEFARERKLAVRRGDGGSSLLNSELTANFRISLQSRPPGYLRSAPKQSDIGRAHALGAYRILRDSSGCRAWRLCLALSSHLRSKWEESTARSPPAVIFDFV